MNVSNDLDGWMECSLTFILYSSVVHGSELLPNWAPLDFVRHSPAEHISLLGGSLLS